LIIERVYDFLNIAESPGEADCIFVFAGQQERKMYGIQLWRERRAPRLILSVGRFEWRKFYRLGLPSDGGLKLLVESTAPRVRHFFVSFDGDDARSVLVKKGRFGTRTEAQGLAQFLKNEEVKSLMIVSTSIHLRRVALALKAALRGSHARRTYVAVPEYLSSLRREHLRSSRDVRREVWREFRKYLGYRIAFALCPGILRRDRA
jgi:uncharacterized SAM-binding protein YcdF (DUF218 family)